MTPLAIDTFPAITQQDLRALTRYGDTVNIYIVPTKQAKSGYSVRAVPVRHPVGRLIATACVVNSEIVITPVDATWN